MREARAQFEGPWVADYLVRDCDGPKRLILLAPNAPFPLPERKADGQYRVGFSWYFYDPTRDEYFIDMSISAGFLSRLVESLGWTDLPKILIGYSQGGYLAPFAAQKMSQVEQIIGVSAQFLDQEIELPAPDKPLPYRMDAVHGADDRIAPFADAQASHRIVVLAGAKGEFRALPGVGHRITAEVQREVADLCLK